MNSIRITGTGVEPKSKSESMLRWTVLASAAEGTRAWRKLSWQNRDKTDREASAVDVAAWILRQ